LGSDGILQLRPRAYPVSFQARIALSSNIWKQVRHPYRYIAAC
jgi:hypothetical protein